MKENLTALKTKFLRFPKVEIVFENVSNKGIPFIVRRDQVHGAEGGYVNSSNVSRVDKGDWMWTDQSRLRLGIFVADCTAIILSGERRGGRFVAAIHAGWRGTAAGIIERAIEELKPDQGVRAWLSPSICQEHFEVGGEVIEAFGETSKKFFQSQGLVEKFLFNLKALQIQKLKNFGVNCYSSSLCTYCQPELLSYRRSKAKLEARHLITVEMKG